MEASMWLAFFAASWAISLSPGPGAVAAMSAGLNHGFARGYFMTFGLILGIITQVWVAAIGLGALIAASSLAFSIVKWLGVAYLVWLGIRQWRSRASPMSSAPTEPCVVRRRDLVLRGWLLNALNPKGTVFMLAVMPQFLDLARPLVPQYLAITATLAFTDVFVMAGYTLLAARLFRLLRAPQQLRWLNRIFGSLFIAAGAVLALFRRA